MHPSVENRCRTAIQCAWHVLLARVLCRVVMEHQDANNTIAVRLFILFCVVLFISRLQQAQILLLNI
jgi:hypothetical protein